MEVTIPASPDRRSILTRAPRHTLALDDRLTIMSITGCPNAGPECPYYGRNTPKALKTEQKHGCYADTDHVIPRFMGRQATASALLKNYIRSTANQEQLCRWDHDRKTVDELKNPPEIPTDRFMIDAIVAARRARKANGRQ